jgi:zinc transport system ATP-binding protein
VKRDSEMSDDIIRMDNLSFSFGEGPVLRDVDIAVPRGQFVSIVGPNGGGKTTLLKLLLGLLKPTTGTIRVFGTSPEKARPRIGYMPQSSFADQTFPVTVRDVVLTGRIHPFGPYRKGDRNAAREALEWVGLDDFESRPFSALSGGQRQRVLIARALSSEPEMLFLDEPTAGLDFQVEEEFFDLLRKLSERLTIVLVSHDVGLVMKTSEAVICVNRKVVMHPTSELTGDMLNEIYGDTMRLVRHDHRV